MRFGLTPTLKQSLLKSGFPTGNHFPLADVDGEPLILLKKTDVAEAIVSLQNPGHLDPSRLLRLGKFEGTIATAPRNPAVFGGVVVKKKSSSEELRFVRS